MIGGDHADTMYRFFLELSLLSACLRKAMGEIADRNTILIGNVECRKETYELLQNTIMKPINADVQVLRNSCMINVYVHSTPKLQKCLVVPMGVKLDSICCERH
jgi:hypothetical protein